MNSVIREDLKKLPDKPGVYIMRNVDNTVLYVGKARILKNRVRSYFRNVPHSNRISVMISQIDHFEYIVCDSEYEALLLENNLIKKYKPKYNVLLKDDKGFPYIKVTVNEEFPRVMLARNIQKDGAKYFGPYHSTWVVNTTLEAIKTILPLRPCKKVIHANSNDRPCLNYHIGLCKAPCCGKITKEEYDAIASDVLDFLGGHMSELENKIKARMLEEAEKLNFEQAAIYREKLKAIQQLAEKQKIVTVSEDDFDVTAIEKNDVDACLQVFFVRGGNVVGREFFIFEGAGTESDEFITTSFIKQFYNENFVIPPRIYTASAPETEEEREDRTFLQEWLTGLRNAKCEILTPQKGSKKKLTEMVKMNAGIALANKTSSFAENGQARKALEILQHVLNLDKIPERIEAVDISNTGDSEINASLVVFIGGTPCKKAYKRYIMKEVQQRNDVGSMQEVLSRRFTAYKEGRDGFTALPDLLLVDGGASQVAVAEEVLRQKNINVPVYGMVKDDKHRTRSLVGSFAGGNAAVIDNRSNYKEFVLKEHIELWRFISSIQDEAHRFAITHNRSLTKKRYRLSELDNIPSIGERKKFLLLKHFGSLAAIRKASVEELAAVKGISKSNAEKIYEHFNNI